MNTAVRITGIATGGDGIGRMADGRAIFLPRTAPGDLVEPTDVRLHSSFARGWPGTFRELSSDRVEPRCAHYERDRCGGCQIQHLSGAAQREAKRLIVADALTRIGGVAVEVPAVETGAEWAYRNRITVSIAKDGAMGFRRVGQANGLFNLTECEIARPSINRLLSAVVAARDALPAPTDRITLREGSEGEMHLVLWSENKPSRREVRGYRSMLSRACSKEDLPQLWWHDPSGRTRSLDSTTTESGAMAFDQVQPDLGDHIRRFALDQLMDVSGRLVWDLFAGRGQASTVLAQRGARVESVERDADLVALAEREVLPSVRRFRGNVEDLITTMSNPDAVVVNPPRSGLGDVVTSRLTQTAAKRISYVSCDPATLARDVKRLMPAYHIETVRAFDLFPQTAHVETVVLLARQ